MTTATANKNEELIRAGYEAFGRGDIAVFQGLFTPDITWHVGGRNPLSGDKRGLEATLEYFGELGARTDGTFRLELEQVFANDSTAVGIHRETARRGGKALNTRCVIIFALSNERVTGAWVHYEDQTVVDAFFA